MSLQERIHHNERLRASGEEPIPGPRAGVRRWARYLKRVTLKKIKIKNPERYLNSHRRTVKQ